MRRVFRVVNGGTPTSGPENWDGGVAWATPVDLALVNGGVVGSTQRTLSKRGLQTGSASIPRRSLVLSTRAPIGYVAETTTDVAFNQGCKGLVPTQPVDIRFFRYQFLSLAGQLQAAGQGSTFVELSGDALAASKIVAPSLPKQRAVADYLDAETARIDALIAKKRRLVELVEERWSSFLVLSLKADTWVPLKSFAGFREGPGILAVDFRDEGTPLLRIGNLTDETISLDGSGFLDPVDVRTRWRHLVVHAGELLVSGSATSGLPVVVPPEVDRAVPYTGLIRVWPSSTRLKRDFLRFFLASRLFLDQVDMLKTGIGLQHWGPSHLGQVKMPLPCEDDQSQTVRELSQLRDRVRSVKAALRTQVDRLVEHRQALITAAVTGELRIAGVAA